MDVNMKYRIIFVGLTFLAFFSPDPAISSQNRYEETIEKSATELFDSIMCPICPAQTISSSSNETSRQMRDLVLKKLRQGETKEEILQYFVSRYGERIMAKPGKEGFNAMLWFLPGVSGILAVIVIYLLIRRWLNRNQVKTVPHFEAAHLAEYEERLEKELKEFDE